MTLTDAAQPLIQVGILTKGRPMLAIVIANLVLQEEYPIEIFVVDTGDEPAIKRVDVVAVLRLAQDRNVRCEYELHRDRNRAFSSGRLKLLENLNGPLVAFMDDDIVLANMVAIASLARRARELGPGLGWVAPYCVNAGSARRFLEDRPHYSPGGIFAQDEVVRNILLEYYNNNSDVLDARGPRERAWVRGRVSDRAVPRPGPHDRGPARHGQLPPGLRRRHALGPHGRSAVSDNA